MASVRRFYHRYSAAYDQIEFVESDHGEWAMYADIKKAIAAAAAESYENGKKEGIRQEKARVPPFLASSWANQDP